MESFSPWKRKRPVYHGTGAISVYRHSLRENFDHLTDANIDLDIHTKRAALKVSASVVSLVSLRGGKAIFMGSGTIIECEDVTGTYFSTILTSASLLRSSTGLQAVADDIKVDVYISDGKLFEGQVFAYDLHYNIAVIKIESDAPLPCASLRLLDDSISVDPSEIACPGDKAEGSESFQLRRNSNLFNLCPGDMVVAIGRYFDKPYKLMPAPGKFSLDCCKFDCRELFRATCKISKCGIGGPLINRYGEVIGVNFYDELCTPFLPINIASKCLEHFKKYGRFCRPWLGMEMTNLYAASVDKLEKIVQKFPNIFKGVIVEEVKPGSPADRAGILRGDVIVQCGGNFVRSFLEFLGIIWDKAGESVEVAVIRERTSERLNLTMVVDETSADKFNSWPVPEKRRMLVERIRLHER